MHWIKCESDPFPLGLEALQSEVFVVAMFTSLNIPRAELCWRGCFSVDGALVTDSLEAVRLFGLKFDMELHQGESRAIPKSTMHGMLTTFLKRYLQCWKPPEGGFNRNCEAGSFWVNFLASTLAIDSRNYTLHPTNAGMLLL